MLTLVRGEANKYVFMSKLFKGTDHAVFIQLGGTTIVPPLEQDCFKIDIDNNRSHKEQLRLIYEDMLEKGYTTLFLYTNLDQNGLNVLKDVYYDLDYNIDIVVSVQDSSVPKGQIIIEELL